jgi:O-antigen ligase
MFLVLASLVVAGIFGVLAARGQGWVATMATIATVGFALLFVRPKLGTIIVLFGVYLNLPVVAVNYHNMPSFFGVAFPLILIVPLTSILLLRRKQIVFDNIFGWMIVFLAVQTLSMLMATGIGVAIDEVMNYVLEGLLLYFLLINVIRTEADLREAIWAIVIAGALMGGIVLYQELTKTYDNNYGGFALRMASFRTADPDTWRDRTAGSIGDPNFFAQVLIMVVPLGVFRLWGERSLILRMLAGVATILVIAGVILTFSRGAALALFGVFGMIAYLWRIKPYQIVLGLAVIIGFVLLVAPDYVGRLQSVTDASGLVNEEGVSDKSILGRATENLAAIYMFLDHPVIGAGPGNYPLLYESYAEQIGLYVRFHERPAHNLYLSFAAELGLLGITTFLALVGVQIRRLLRIIKHRNEILSAANMAAATLVSLCAYLMTGMFLHMAYQRFFWIIMSLASAAAMISLARLEKRQQEEIATSTDTSATALPSTAPPSRAANLT